MADFVKNSRCQIQTNVTQVEHVEQVAHEGTSVPTAELLPGQRDSGSQRAAVGRMKL